MRADARRNHALLLDAARDVFVEQGPQASLEEIARRAGVGIATLYRRFADRAGLMHAVVVAALDDGNAAAERASATCADPFDALRAYAHAVLDLRTSAVISTLLDDVDLEDPEIKRARDISSRLAEQLFSAAQDVGDVRKDATFGDIGVMLVRLSRPLPGPIPAQTQDALAHRHADVFLAGLRADAAPLSLEGPALDLTDLRRFTEDAARRSSAVD
jgi:AcrR family transcriptional regulator